MSQVWGALLGIYTNNYTNENGKQDTFELRPFIWMEGISAQQKEMEHLQLHAMGVSPDLQSRNT